MWRGAKKIAMEANDKAKGLGTAVFPARNTFVDAPVFASYHQEQATRKAAA